MVTMAITMVTIVIARAVTTQMKVVMAIAMIVVVNCDHGSGDGNT